MNPINNVITSCCSSSGKTADFGKSTFYQWKKLPFWKIVGFAKGFVGKSSEGTLNLEHSAHIPPPEELLVRNWQHFSSTAPLTHQDR